MAVIKNTYVIGNIRVKVVRTDTGYRATTHHKGAKQSAYYELPSDAIIAVVNLCE